MFKISLNDLSKLFNSISSEQSLYIPADAENGSASFQKYVDGLTMTEQLNTNRSAKDFFFPQMENLYEIKMTGKKIELTDTREECEDFVIFGVRACDVRSFDILDSVYLSEPVDSYYKNRREHATVVSLACNEPDETCFCGTFGIDATNPAGDVTAWKTGSDMYFKANTDKGEKLLDSVKSLLSDSDDTEVENSKSATKEILSKLPLAGLSFDGVKAKSLLENFNNEKWAGLSESCLGCGTCTFVCPTCQCYDIRDFDTGNGVKKFRCWDSCMYSDFTKMAHGNPRLTQVERFRQRFMHKLVYYPENNGSVFGCVGCGRCLAKCPISMNIVKVAKALGVDE
jgi:heterodisulfide reductase subunit C